MNALQRDLKKLVPLVESLGKETVAADPHRQRFHLQPPVGWLNVPETELCCITLSTVTSIFSLIYEINLVITGSSTLLNSYCKYVNREFIRFSTKPLWSISTC